MAFVTANRVKDYTTTAGTGNITLAGTPPTGFKQFNGSIATGSTLHYCLVDGANTEIGLGTFTEPSTLARTTPIETFYNGVLDTTSPTAIPLSGNSVEVFVTEPAQNQHDTFYISATTSGTTGSVSTSVITLADGYLKSIIISNESTTLTASDTEYLTFSLVNKGTDGNGTTSMLTANNTTKTTVGHLGVLTQYAPKTLLLSSTYSDLAIVKNSCLVLTTTTTTASTLAAKTLRVVFVYGQKEQ